MANPKEYITTTNSIGGWKAVLIKRDKDGFEEPWSTGVGAYKTQREAAQEAQSWARAEEIPYIAAKEGK